MVRRKAKAMAPQVDTVELPDVIHTTSPDLIEPTQLDVSGGWVFPDHYSEEDIRDWLVTHPEGRPQVETIDIDPELGGGETGTAGEPTEWSEAQVISALKADGTYAAAMAVPPELADLITSDNYDPREFFLVHSEIWNSMVSAMHAEAELGLENKELHKRVNALTRGMRKVNKHWSATKRELKHLEQRHRDAAREHMEKRVKIYGEWSEAATKKDIFANRIARRLRKARAGRDKRERQLLLEREYARGLSRIMESQDAYIKHLENLLNGGPLPTEGRTQL